MDYSVFHLHLTQDEGNNKKIGLKNVLDQTLSGICASFYRHVLNCTFPKIFRDISHPTEVHETIFCTAD